MLYVEALIDAHKERLARFAWAAQHPKIKNRTVTRDVPVKTYDEVAVLPVDLHAWAERQKQNYKAPWFEIVDGPTEFEPKNKLPPTIDHIQKIVCRHYLINQNDMLSNRRTKDACLPRHVAMYLCKQLTTRSLPEIGRRFNGRDHTTALSAIRKISRMIGENINFAEEVEDLRKKCEA